jgi:hypothetical protein
MEGRHDQPEGRAGTTCLGWLPPPRLEKKRRPPGHRGPGTRHRLPLHRHAPDRVVLLAAGPRPHM